ncbi:MAG: hypothetical protein M1833_002406 [Piccolia ochrophora]|nr:MAG: hypothetical protein M1833_002406 [Piccolia ochrophora]
MATFDPPLDRNEEQEPSSRDLEAADAESITTSDTQGGHLETYGAEKTYMNGPGLENLDHDPVTRSTTKSSWKDPGPPPDGGLVAWTQVIMGHLVVFNTWGYISSFGVFQSYYAEALSHPPSDISWVGSVQIFLLFFVGTFSGRATDAGYFHQTFLAGSILVVLGIFMTSLATEYWQLFLAQGVCTGLGNGLVFCPSLSLLSTYFSKHRSLAIGIAASGSATGGLVYPAMVQQLLPRIGFPWTIRAVGFVALGTMAVANVFSRTRLPPRKTGPLVEWSAFREASYSFFSVGMFLTFWGLYFAFYYIGPYGRDIIGLTREDSISLLLVMNGVGLVGRLVPNYAADRWLGPLNTLVPFIFATAFLVYCWIAVSAHGGLFAFAAVYGIFAAGIQSLFPATVSSLTTDLRKAGVRMGMIFSIVSFACLTGPPIAGALIQRGQGTYLYAQLFSGSVMMAGCCILVAARIAKTGLVWKQRT